MYPNQDLLGIPSGISNSNSKFWYVSQMKTYLKPTFYAATSPEAKKMKISSTEEKIHAGG